MKRNAVIKDSDGAEAEAASALPGDTPPSDLVESKDSALTSEMKKFEELLEKLQVNWSGFPMTFLRLIKIFQLDVSKLHNHRRKYKARFNFNVEVISGKLSQFDDRLAEVNAEYTMLFDQVDTIHLDIPDIQAQLGFVQERAWACASAILAIAVSRMILIASSSAAICA
jgi:hypothetical protein